MDEKLPLKEYLTAREKVYEFLGQVKSIDQLMKDKVEPYILMEEQPIPVMVGSKTVYVGNLNLDYEQKYFNGWAGILAGLGIKDLFLELMSDGKELFKYLAMYKDMYKKTLKLIYGTLLKQQWYYSSKKSKLYKLNKCSLRYFRDHMTKEKLIEMIYLLYLYNYDSSKKSLALILERMGAAKEITQTYMYNWLENCTGVSGRFAERRLPKLDWYNPDSVLIPAAKVGTNA